MLYVGYAATTQINWNNSGVASLVQISISGKANKAVVYTSSLTEYAGKLEALERTHVPLVQNITKQ